MNLLLKGRRSGKGGKDVLVNFVFDWSLLVVFAGLIGLLAAYLADWSVSHAWQRWVLKAVVGVELLVVVSWVILLGIRLVG